jgi:hypothetical protein
MNAKTDRWESYTDEVGRRHWRWPASEAQRDASRMLAEAGPRYPLGSPIRQRQAQPAPLPPKGE